MSAPAPRLVLFFVDGLDYRFVCRNYHHSGCLAELFAPEHLFRIRGNCHSLECLADVLLGRRAEVFAYEGFGSLPADEIPDWRALLRVAPERDLLWNRLNTAGYRVGLLEFLGICDSPHIDGFCVTKNLERVGLGEAYRSGATHFPADVGRRFGELKRRHAFPPPPSSPAPHFRQIVGQRVPGTLRPEQARRVYCTCRYMERLVPRAEAYARSLFEIAAELMRRHPVDVLMLHMGHLDCLLHLYFDFHDDERELMLLLDRILGHLRRAVGFDELLVFSDHGMRCAAPYVAGDLLYRTHHDAQNAVLGGHGEALTRLLDWRAPEDLTAVHHLAFDATLAVAPRHA